MKISAFLVACVVVALSVSGCVSPGTASDPSSTGTADQAAK
jgi:outer membrane lipoprotein SlyB